MGAPSNLSPGDMVGRYRVEGPLGEGGMGSVYRAVDPDGGEVALKLIKPDLATDHTFRRRFDREARIAQQVRHPHVVPVLDTGEHQGVPYLAQRFVGNGNLADWIERDGTLGVAAMVKICAEVASGLDALHESGLVHRDVKPANILIDQDGMAYVTDFGLAKDTQGSMLTKPGQAVGSLDYMAPEQIRSEDVTAATDVYALGCVMFECLCGSPPFADRQGMRVLWAHLQDPAPNPCTRRSDVAGPIGDAIVRALGKDQANRPQSAGDFARILAEAAS